MRTIKCERAPKPVKGFVLYADLPEPPCIFCHKSVRHHESYDAKRRMEEET